MQQRRRGLRFLPLHDDHRRLTRAMRAMSANWLAD
jgi:hypothetical protein